MMLDNIIKKVSFLSIKWKRCLLKYNIKIGGKMYIVLTIIIVLLLGTCLFVISKNKRLKSENLRQKNEVKKTLCNNVILRDWILLKQKGVKLEKWLIQNDIKQIAIYGYGILGKVLLSELKDSSIEVISIIEKNYTRIYADVPVVSIDDVPQVDAVIVSVVNYYDEIENDLLLRCKCAIISLEDVIYGVGLDINEQ